MEIYGLNLSKLFAYLLCFSLASPFPLSAATSLSEQSASQQPQQPPPTGTPTQQLPEGTGLGRRLPPGGIRILVLEGQNMRNSIQTRSAISPVVQILDSLDQPVAGATVTFEVSPTGAGGFFGTPPNANAPMATVRSDFAGQATAPFTPNTTAGRFTIKVTATLESQSAQAAIVQTNDPTVVIAGVAPPKKHWYQSWKWWAVIGGGAIAAGIVLSKTTGGGKPTIVITPTPVDIGAPR
jgi:hypothetical protein